MKSYLLISFVLHSMIFGGFILLKSNEADSINVEKKQIGLQSQKEKSQNKNNFLEVNEEKEAIMNAISITEEELEKEIYEIQKLQENEEFERKQKYELLEKSIELKKRELERQERLQQEKIQEEKEKIEQDKKDILDFKEEIKSTKNSLSQKEKELDKAMKEIEIKKKEFKELIQHNNSSNEKEIAEKEIRIQQQKDIIDKMNQEIIDLKGALGKELDKYKTQSVITDKKEKKNEILDNKSEKEIEQLKKELIEYNSMIKERVLNNWNYNADIGGVSCYINIFQSNTGDILRVTTRDCIAPDEFINSIKEATWKASPLPLPDKESLFSKSIDLYFTIK